MSPLPDSLAHSTPPAVRSAPGGPPAPGSGEAVTAAPVAGLTPGSRRADARRRSAAVILASLAIAVLVASGCGSSADPDTWEEAEQGEYEGGDSAVEENFMAACELANDTSTGGDLNAAEARVLCECAFDGLRSSLTLQEFKSLDQALREAPNPSDLDEEPEDVWDDTAEAILTSCARKVDA